MDVESALEESLFILSNRFCIRIQPLIKKIESTITLSASDPLPSTIEIRDAKAQNAITKGKIHDNTFTLVSKRRLILDEL